MALFGSKKVNATPAFASAPVQAAAGSAAQVGQFYTYSVGASQELALSVPTVARSIQMIASMVGCLELKHYTTQWTGSEYEEIYIPNEQWMDQPDPKVTRNFIFAQLVTDLILWGSGYWFITSRSQATGRPLSFQWLPAAMVNTVDQPGAQRFGPSDNITFNGIQLNTDDVIQFLAPTQGLLYTGNRAINTAIKLQQAADRFAVNEIAAGWLQQTDASEPMSAEDLSELAAAWRNARQVGAIGALNSVITFKEFSADPNKLQLVEARQFQALELSRSTGIPPYLLGIGVSGSYTYQNAQQARQDLYLFGTKQYLDCIEQTLSMNQILPRGRYVKFDVSDYIYENDLGNVEREADFNAQNREEEYS
jgi:HK97 family phage portal protein